MEHEKLKGNTALSEEFFQQYLHHATVLRNWFVAYGIGGAILFVSNTNIFGSLSASTKFTIVIAFLTGVLVQVLLAFYNKIIHWGVYRGESELCYKSSKFYKISESLSTFFWIDILIDLITFGCFITATIQLIWSLFTTL